MLLRYGWESILNAFKSGILPIKATQGKELKILTPKQMLQRLPIALAQVKAGNTSENLLSEIRANRMEQEKFLENYVTI